MNVYLLPLLAFLTVGQVAARAALPPDLYRQSHFPSSPMPSTVSPLLHPDDHPPGTSADRKGGGDSVQPPLRDGLANFFINYKPPGPSADRKGGGDSVQPPLRDGVAKVYVYKPSGNSADGKGGGDSVQPPLRDGVAKVYVYKPSVTIDAGGKGRGVSVPLHLRDGLATSRISYRTRHDGSDDPSKAMFLLEKDLKVGHKMNMDFSATSPQRPFLSPQLAQSIPFSLAQLDDILKRLNIKPGSHDAQVMKQTLMDCEALAIRGEHKHCATSLESMVGFATSQIGEEVEALFTKVVKKETTSSSGKQEYTIAAAGVKKVAENTVVGCHRQEYPYAVFYCHKSENTTSYTVPLEGADGTRVKAVAVCHTDTSQWDPHHISFQVLKVKPGTVPICHFIPPQDNLVWVPKRLQIP